MWLQKDHNNYYLPAPISVKHSIPKHAIGSYGRNQKRRLFLIIGSTVSCEAAVVTDEYPGYDKLKENFLKAKQRKSNKEKTFTVVHQQIMNMKGWLRGIHHQFSDKHYQKYLDDYCFRTNRRNTEQGIFKAGISKSLLPMRLKLIILINYFINNQKAQ